MLICNFCAENGFKVFVTRKLDTKNTLIYISFKKEALLFHNYFAIFRLMHLFFQNLHIFQIAIKKQQELTLDICNS